MATELCNFGFVDKYEISFEKSDAYVGYFNEGDRREKSVIFISRNDRNGAIFGKNHTRAIGDMAEKYNLMIQFTSSPDETFKKFLKITSDVNEVAQITFLVHGSWDRMTFVEKDDFKVTEKENFLLRGVLAKLKANGTVALISCSTGVEGGVADFIAKHLSRSATIFAPTDKVNFVKLVSEDSALVNFSMYKWIRKGIFENITRVLHVDVLSILVARALKRIGIYC